MSGWAEDELKAFEEQFGTHKKIVRLGTGEAFKVPLRDIITKGVKEQELDKYPKWDESEVPQ